MDGVPQAFGGFVRGDALCALGVLGRAIGLDLRGCCVYPSTIDDQFALVQRERRCPVCGATTIHEGHLIAHLNDEHRLDFLAIANKLPVSDPA